MYIKPTSKAMGSIFDIDDAIEPMLYPMNDEVPCPWDADIVVKEGTVYLSGYLSSGGPRGAICRCECRVADFARYYRVEINNSDDEGIMEKIFAAGWERA